MLCSNAVSRSSRKPVRRLPAQQNSTTVLTVNPPDELYLKTIRRRSAYGRLEETLNTDTAVRTQHENSELSISLAIASALPPAALDSPPPYSPLAPGTSLPRLRQPSSCREFYIESFSPKDVKSQASIISRRLPELFFGDALCDQIDATIAQFASFQVTEPTPNKDSNTDWVISPMNEQDLLYQQRRRFNKQPKRDA